MSSDHLMDRVAIALARGRSRRDALRGVAAIFGGLLLGGISTTRVYTQGRGCAERCREQGHTGRDLGQCIQDCQRNGIPCGPTTCPADEVCCNESCGICTPPGGVCTQQFCP